MMKKFRKWRDKLTISQVKKIMWIVGILTAVILMLIIIVCREQIIMTNSEECPTYLLFILAFIIIPFCNDVIVYFVLNGDYKERELKRNEIEKKIAPKLKEDQFIEVYLKKRTRIGVEPVILDGYDAHEFRYFVKKKEDGIYIIMKEAEKIIKEYSNFNYLVFEYVFSFTKEEK